MNRHQAAPISMRTTQPASTHTRTPAGRQGRNLGGSFFTTGANFTGWAFFQMQQPQYDALTPWLKARYL